MRTDAFRLYLDDMSADSPFHAIVLGGSVAGLFAARVLADHAESVTLVERHQHKTEVGLLNFTPWRDLA